MQRNGKETLQDATDDDSLSRIKKLLEHSSEKEIIEALSGDNSGTSYSKSELVYAIENLQVSKTIRTIAYYGLIQYGDLETLQRLSTLIDFNYIDKFGNDAFRSAVAFRRLDVVKWLAAEVPQFINISPERRIEIILLAITNNNDKCLELFSKAVADGGFGWDLNVKHKNGYTPVRMALQSENNWLAIKLVAGRNEGGYGLPLQKSDFRKILSKQQFPMFPRDVYLYLRKKPDKPNKPGRKISSVALTNSKTGKLETYEPVRQLGMGGHGKVRLFASATDNSRLIAIKQCRLDNQPALSGYGIVDTATTAKRELEFMHRMYPEQQPYFIKHYLNHDGKYDYRMVMPYLAGEDIMYLIFNITSANDLAKLLLAVAEEIQRMHELDIVHGDIKMANILVDAQLGNDIATAVFKVKIIDYGSSQTAGEAVELFNDKRDYLAPERYTKTNEEIYANTNQDVYSFAVLVTQALKIFEIKNPKQKELLTKKHPSLGKFSVNGINSIPENRTNLRDFIQTLKSELHDQLIKDALYLKLEVDAGVSSNKFKHN